MLATCRMARKVKKTSAKSRVNVSVNVNSKNKRTVVPRRRELPAYLPPVRVEVLHGTTPQLPPVYTQPMPHYGPQPVGLTINNNQGGSEASRSGPTTTVPAAPASTAEKVEVAGKHVKETANKFADHALTASTGIAAVGFPQVAAGVAGVGAVAKTFAKAGSLAENGGYVAKKGKQAYDAAADVASKAKEAFYSTTELVNNGISKVMGQRQAPSEAGESTDFLNDMTKEQLREFIVSNGGNLDGFNARTGKQDILSRAKQVARR